MPVIVMIDGEHGVNLFAHKESRFAVGEFFRGLGQLHTDPPDPPDVVFARRRFGPCDHLERI